MKKKSIAVIIGLALVIAFIYAGCEMTVNEPIRSVPIFKPYISVQPASHSFAVTDTSYQTLALSVEVWEWDAIEGALSYQWYGFTKLEQFYKDEAEPVGAGPVFAPAITNPQAGDRYYYYVVVTNTNPTAVGALSDSITSDVAIIAFTAAGAPPAPEIAQNPGSSAYTMGRASAVAPLDVRASAAAVQGETTALSYQWFSFQLTDDFNLDGTPKGTAIAGAQSRTYLPEIDELGVGDNYYYVVVSNILFTGGGEESARSDVYSLPAKITMNRASEALVPRINGQPRSLLYFTGATLDATSPKLSVNATSLDRGTLSYQWYSVTNAAGANPTAINTDNGRAKDFLPPISTSVPGTTYYYVVVKNTVDAANVEEGGATEKSTLPSKVATVQVAAEYSGAAANLIVTVDPTTRYQYIRGYGGMEVAWANFPETYPADTENMYNPDILGFNILRIMMPVSNVDVDQAMDDLVSSHRQYYYENVKIVNKYGGYVLASPWSPPKEWKTNNSINGGGSLIRAYHKQYANYLRSFARHMSNKGAPIYAISIQNEPNYVAGYDGCEWTPEHMRDFFIEVGRFTQGIRGYGGGKVTPTVLTMNGESANDPGENHAAIDNPASFAAIDIFARHVYGERQKNLWTSRPALQQSGKEVWMTEHNINSATAAAFPNDWTWNYIWAFMNDVDLVMRLNNENAFVWWAHKRFYSFIGDADANTSNGAILPRGWGLAHYSKFTIDMTRVGTTHSGTLNGTAINANNLNASPADASDAFLDNTSARITAYESRDGKEISLVMWTPTNTSGTGGFALGNVQIKLPNGFTIRSATAMRSSTGTNNQGVPESVTIGSDRNSAYVSVPASQILSVKFIKEE